MSTSCSLTSTGSGPWTKRASRTRSSMLTLFVCCSLVTACFILTVLTRWPHIVHGEVFSFLISLQAVSDIESIRSMKKFKCEMCHADLLPRFVYPKLGLHEKALSKDIPIHCKAKAKIPTLPEVYKTRNAVMRDYCHATTNFTSSNPWAYYKREDLQHIYVNDQHRFLFCRLPKTGISNWKRVLIYLMTKGADSDVFSRSDAQIHESFMLEWTRLNLYSEKDILCRLHSYLKIIFVRHPLDRLLSAYRSKFLSVTRENERDFFQKYGRTIIKRYRNNPSREALNLGSDVQFDEFLRYVRDTPLSSLDRHWAPYEDQCLLCKINYDFIGKHESMNVDADYLLDLWKVNNIRFPPPYRDLSDEACHFKKFYDNIPPKLVDDVAAKFNRDTLMFGYAKFPPFIAENDTVSVVANTTYCKN